MRAQAHTMSHCTMQAKIRWHCANDFEWEQRASWESKNAMICDRFMKIRRYRSNDGSHTMRIFVHGKAYAGTTSHHAKMHLTMPQRTTLC
jgi:hypothetical protein